MHMRAVLGHLAGDDPFHPTPVEELDGEVLHHLHLGTLAHADQHRVVSNRHNISALQGRTPEILCNQVARIPTGREPELELSLPKHRMIAVHRCHVVDLETACFPIHRVQYNTAVYPARGVSSVERIWQWGQHEVVRGGHRCGQGTATQLSEIEAPDLRAGQTANQELHQVIGRESGQIVPK